MLTINITVLYQIIGYAVFLIIIHYLLRNPVLKLLDERDRRTNGKRAEAEKIEATIASGIEDYEARLKDATLQGMEERGKIKEEALADEQVIIEKAKEEADSYLEGIKGEIASSKTQALGDLMKETRTFSREIADKVLSTKTLSLLAFIAPAALILLPSLAFASSEGGEGGSSGMLWKVINFTALVIGVYFVWKKVVKKMLIDRSEDIKNALAEAAQMKEDALAKEKEYNEKLKLFDTTIKEVHDGLRKDGEDEKARIIQEANDAADMIKEQVKKLVEFEVDKGKAEIRREVALLSIDLAEDILKKELTDEDQERLIKESLDKIRLN